MITRIWLQITMCFLIVLSAAVCCCAEIVPNPFRAIEVSDLVGTWRADYDENDFLGRGCQVEVTGVETITLRAGGTYQQIYDNERGYVYLSPWNRWYLENRKGVGGGVVLHLEGGRFYPLGVERAESLAKGLWVYHSEDDGRGNPLDLDGTEVILNVAVSSRIPGGIGLHYPPVCSFDLPVTIDFYPVTTSIPTPADVP